MDKYQTRGRPHSPDALITCIEIMFSLFELIHVHEQQSGHNYTYNKKQIEKKHTRVHEINSSCMYTESCSIQGPY